MLRFDSNIRHRTSILRFDPSSSTVFKINYGFNPKDLPFKTSPLKIFPILHIEPLDLYLLNLLILTY